MVKVIVELDEETDYYVCQKSVQFKLKNKARTIERIINDHMRLEEEGELM